MRLVNEMNGSVFWNDIALSPGRNPNDLAGLPGRVFDDAFPQRLISELALLAGRVGGSSNTTGIINHSVNAFEGFDGCGWSDRYFEDVERSRDRAVDEWAQRARDLASDIMGITRIVPARDRYGRDFTPAVVRETSNGIGWHFDFAHLEYPGTELDGGPSSNQYSIITYLNSPGRGELEVSEWKPAGSGAHPAASYPLDEQKFRSSPRRRITPKRGRTVLVSSEYAHRVHDSDVPRKFVTMFISTSEYGATFTFG